MTFLGIFINAFLAYTDKGILNAKAGSTIYYNSIMYIIPVYQAAARNGKHYTYIITPFSFQT